MSCNWADIDKAIGQLFTTLSGQTVVLPFEREVDGVFLPVAIVPDDQGGSAWHSAVQDCATVAIDCDPQHTGS